MHREIENLISAALSFDPRQWLATFEPVASSDDPEKRFHIASALKSAVCLFPARTGVATSLHTKPRIGYQLVDVQLHANEIIHHISFISPGDATFQSTCWPAFLAGAETQMYTHRIWIRERLSNLWDHMHWGYVCTAQEVLDIVWRSRDASRHGGKMNWVEEVRKTGVKYLIA